MFPDKNDLKILYELDRNCRLPMSQIGKKVNLSKQAVAKKIENLVTGKVISQFITVLNLAFFGNTPYKTFISLQKTSSKIKSEIAEFLQLNQEYGTFAFLEGHYDLYIGIATDNVNNLEAALAKFYFKFSDYIKLRKNIALLDTKIMPRDYLIDKKRDLSPEFKKFNCNEGGCDNGNKNNLPSLKEIDFKILTMISEKPRISYTEIAQKLSSNIQTVINRMKALNDNVISGYGIWLNERDFPQYKVLIELSAISEETLKRIESFLVTQPNVIFIVKTFGEWDYEFTVEGKNIEECRKFINEFKNKFSGELKSFIPLLVEEVPKMHFLPRI